MSTVLTVLVAPVAPVVPEMLVAIQLAVLPMCLYLTLMAVSSHYRKVGNFANVAPVLAKSTRRIINAEHLTPAAMP